MRKHRMNTSTGLWKHKSATANCQTTWVWLEITELGFRRCLSLFPYTKVPFSVPFFEPFRANRSGPIGQGLPGARPSWDDGNTTGLFLQKDDKQEWFGCVPAPHCKNQKENTILMKTKGTPVRLRQASTSVQIDKKAMCRGNSWQDRLGFRCQASGPKAKVVFPCFVLT